MAVFGHDPGADLNQAVVSTQPATPANPTADTRAAPELRRQHRIAAERSGEPLPSRFPCPHPGSARADAGTGRCGRPR